MLSSITLEAKLRDRHGRNCRINWQSNSEFELVSVHSRSNGPSIVLCGIRLEESRAQTFEDTSDPLRSRNGYRRLRGPGRIFSRV
jgi:hypothetical protein